jgi:hypothetical protein
MKLVEELRMLSGIAPGTNYGEIHEEYERT